MKLQNVHSIITSINEVKQKYGKELVILGHYYQRREILDFADYLGDSFELRASCDCS